MGAKKTWHRVVKIVYATLYRGTERGGEFTPVLIYISMVVDFLKLARLHSIQAQLNQPDYPKLSRCQLEPGSTYN